MEDRDRLLKSWIMPPSKLESQRLFEKILFARKGTSISSGSPREVHRQEDSRTHHFTIKKRSGRDSISKNTPTSLRSNSKILKEYTEMIDSAKKMSQSNENDSLLAAGPSKNSTGLLTPRLSSQESTLRKSWLYRSVKENHPSLLKRRSSNTTKLTNQKSSSNNSPKKSMPRNHQRSRSSITYENSRISSKKKSHENSNLSSSEEDEEKAKLPRSRRISKRKSHKFYKSLAENDILHDLENAQRRVSSASREKLTLDSHKKSNENERSKATASTSTHKPTAEKNARKKSGYNNKSKNSRHDTDHSDSTDDKNITDQLRKKSFILTLNILKMTRYKISLSLSQIKIEEEEYTAILQTLNLMKTLPLKRKVVDSNTINEESDPSPLKRKRKENVKNKKTLTADPSPSLQFWLKSAGGDHNKKTPEKRPTKNFKPPHVMHSTRIEERHKKVHESKPQVEDSYIDQSQLFDHPPLPRVNESSINHTSDDDLGSRQHNRVGQGTSRYSMGFGPPTSTPRGLKIPKKRIQDESLHDTITNDDTLQPEVNEGECVKINSCSKDSRDTDETMYTVGKKQRTKRKSSKQSINRKSLKFPNQALETDGSLNLNDNEMVLHEIIDPVSVVEHSVSKVESPSRKNQNLSKNSNSGKTNKKSRKEKTGKNNSKNNTTLKSVQDAGKGTDGRKVKKPRKNVSKNNITLKSTQASVKEETTTLARDESSTEETLTSPRKNKKKKTFMMAAVVRKSSLPLDIVIPKENNDQGLRRSRRIRTRPLGYGEHLVYDEHYQIIIGIERNHSIIPIDVARETGNVIHLDSMVKIKPKRKKVFSENENYTEKENYRRKDIKNN